MGRLSRCVGASALALAWSALAAGAVAAFDGFGEPTADSTFDEAVTFEIPVTGGEPDRLELLLRTPGSDASFVIQVEMNGDEAAATYEWDTSTEYVTPNTLITYQWRAIEGDEVTLSDEATVRYEDDRPGLDWQTEQLGETTVHWYGDAGAQATRFGELAAIGVEQGEQLLGTELAGPVDVFVYDDEEDFFAALGPGAREWTGAAAFSEIRTIFMWLGGGPPAYLETAMIHEITHIVFHDATDNPYHEPATWLNEGIAVWAENADASDAAAFVRNEASGQGLFAFEAISERFPIGDRESSLSYAQGAAMIDFITDRYGRDALAVLTAAYRDGASDADALEAATGVPAAELYEAFYAEFGVGAPTPVEPEPIPPSNVERPEPGDVDPGGVDGEGPGAGDPDPAPSPGAGGVEPPVWVAAIAIGLAVVAVAALAFLVSRRAARGRPS